MTAIMQKIHFTKMHGCGNDYIYVDTAHDDIPNPSEAAILLSDRHKGIGSDGLVLIGRSPTEEADFTMRIFNADGSEAMMCGNASRCIGKYVYERGLTEKKVLRLLTPSGIKVLMLNVEKSLQGNRVESVTVDMGEPQVADSQLSLGDEALSLSMGNPHHVVFVGDVENMDVASEGARLEYHPQLPERSNVEFAEVRPEGIRMRVWERGSGITMACGTGACATAVAAAITGRSSRQSRIIMDGGTLNIEWREDDGHVYLSGPAVIAFEGTVELKCP